MVDTTRTPAPLTSPSAYAEMALCSLRPTVPFPYSAKRDSVSLPLSNNENQLPGRPLLTLLGHPGPVAVPGAGTKAGRYDVLDRPGSATQLGRERVERFWAKQSSKSRGGGTHM